MTKPVTCAQCSKRFGPSLKTETLEGGGELWWFACLHCGHRTEVARISAKGVEIRGELQRLQGLMVRTSATLREIERLQKAMAAEVTKPG